MENDPCIKNTFLFFFVWTSFRFTTYMYNDVHIYHLTSLVINSMLRCKTFILNSVKIIQNKQKVSMKQIISNHQRNTCNHKLKSFVTCFVSVKQVFSDMDFLGWYTTGEQPTQSDIRVHKQVKYTSILSFKDVSVQDITYNI